MRLPKSELLTLLSRHPSPRDLYQVLSNRLEGRALAAAPQPPPAHAALPPPDLPPVQTAPPAAPSENKPTTAVFAVASRRFLGPPDQPKEPEGTPHPVRQDRPDPIHAYAPVHLACATLLYAIQELTHQYGREWLQWEQAQEDLARLRAALAPD